jgi:hypothetical protein
MTKKTITVYSLLFLCAFAFGLSFTLASEAEASPTCCTKWCDGYPFLKDYEGQMINGCVYTGDTTCPIEVYTCPE